MLLRARNHVNLLRLQRPLPRCRVSFLLWVLMVLGSLSYIVLLLWTSSKHPIDGRSRHNGASWHRTREIVSPLTHPELGNGKNHTMASKNNMPTIVVSLSGAMGNQLSEIAHGRGLQFFLLQEFGLSSRLLLHHPNPSNYKFEHVRQEIQQCFPRLAEWDYFRKSTNSWLNSFWWRRASPKQEQDELAETLQRARVEQARVLSNPSQADRLKWINGKSIPGRRRKDVVERLQVEHLRQAVAAFVKLRDKMQSDPDQIGRNQVSLPFLESHSLDFLKLFDGYYDQMRELFAYDWTSPDCCGASVPSPDETVWHFRNFEAEMPLAAVQRGFEELDANQTALQLLAGHSKIAMATPPQLDASHVVQFLREILPVRVVSHQSALHGFCFLAKTKHELVVHRRSTFGIWASIFSSAPTQFYLVDSVAMRLRFATNRLEEYFGDNFETPALKDRIKLRIYSKYPKHS